MRKYIKIALLVAMLPILGAANGGGCDGDPPRKSSDTIQQEQQEKILQEGTASVGMPAIVNFREKRLLKDIFELRDQSNLTTYTYLYNEMTGKLVFFCDSIGYGIPYATQFTSPGKPYGYSATQSGAFTTIPQADPNGLFSPASATGTWVMCQNPQKKGEVKPVYVEPNVIVTPFVMPIVP